MKIKFKRYYKWNQDTEVKDSVARKGEIFTHYQDMNASLTLINREPISPWLQYLGITDKHGAEWYHQDIIITNNQRIHTTEWSGMLLSWKLVDKNDAWYNIDPNVSEIVGNYYTHKELLKVKDGKG